MPLGFMPGKGTTDALFILRRMQEEYSDKEKKHVDMKKVHVDMKKALDKNTKEGNRSRVVAEEESVPEIMVRLIMKLYEEAGLDLGYRRNFL